MKTQQLFAIFGIVAIVSLGIMAFKPSPAAKTVEHLIIFAEHYDLNGVHISIDGKEFKKLKFTKQQQGTPSISTPLSTSLTSTRTRVG